MFLSAAEGFYDTTPDAPIDPGFCEDFDDSCNEYAINGACEEYKAFMVSSCISNMPVCRRVTVMLLCAARTANISVSHASKHAWPVTGDVAASDQGLIPAAILAQLCWALVRNWSSSQRDVILYMWRL